MGNESLEDERWEHEDQSWQEKHRMAYSLFKTLSCWIEARLMRTETKVISLAEGDGFFLSQIMADSKIAIDFSQVAVNKCKAKGLEAFKIDIEKEDLPFEDKEFDVAFLIDVLEHVWLPEVLLKEACRVGKYVIVTVPNFSFLKDRLQMLFGLVPQSMGHKKGHCFFMNLKELTNVCEQAGIQIIKLEAYYPLKHKPLLGTISYIIYRLFPNLWATSYAILLK